MTALVAMLTAVALVANGSPAAATVVFRCRATAANQSGTFSLNQVISARAAATVHPGEPLDIVLDPSPNRIPASVGGHTVKTVTDLVLSIPVPAYAAYRTARLTGSGAGLHSIPTVGLGGRTVVVKVPGPIHGGGIFELPVLTLSLTAGSAGQVVSRIGGVSYDRPGLTATAMIGGPFGIAVRAATRCYPAPNPVLTVTMIG
jgi:dehydratase